MEGWVNVKLRGLLGTSFDTYYAILDGQQLMYYASLDDSKKPTTIKGSLNCQGGKVVKKNIKTNPKKEKFWIILTDKKNNYFEFDCRTASEWNLWYNACEKAVELHTVESKAIDEHNAKREMLGFAPISEHDSHTEKHIGKAAITKAYKVRAMKAHPDRGGDPHEFNQIASAYTQLLAWQAWHDEQKKFRRVEYEAVIEKTREGMGIKVAWNEVRGLIAVTDVKEKVIVKALTDGADGAICPGDALIGIDDEDCSHWKISRLTSRLSSARVPAGSSVHLTFVRWVNQDIQEENTPATSPSNTPVKSPISDPWDNSYQNNDDDGISVNSTPRDSPAQESTPVAPGKEVYPSEETPEVEYKGGSSEKKTSKRRASIGVVAAPVDSLTFASDRINDLCQQKADLHGQVAELESSQLLMRDKVQQLLEMLEVRRSNVTGPSNALDELELTVRELDRLQQNLLLKRSENRQLASHLSGLRHALNRPLIDSVEAIRRSVNLTQVPDESALRSTKVRALAYQEARTGAQQTVELLLELL